MYNQSVRPLEKDFFNKKRNEESKFILISLAESISLVCFLLSIVFCHCLQIKRVVWNSGCALFIVVWLQIDCSKKETRFVTLRLFDVCCSLQVLSCCHSRKTGSCFRVKIFNPSLHPWLISFLTAMWGSPLIIQLTGILTQPCSGLLRHHRAVQQLLTQSITVTVSKSVSEFEIVFPLLCLSEWCLQPCVLLNTRMTCSTTAGVTNTKSAIVRNLTSWIIRWWRLTVLGKILRSDHFLPQIAASLLNRPLPANTFKSTGQLIGTARSVLRNWRRIVFVSHPWLAPYPFPYPKEFVFDEGNRGRQRRRQQRTSRNETPLSDQSDKSQSKSTPHLDVNETEHQRICCFAT